MPDAEPPRRVDIERPSVARMYDVLLGGAHNFAVDRRMAEQMITAYPLTPVIAHANRAFVRRAVRYLVDSGVRQFLDLGAGIPAFGYVHEIAQRIDPDARVVYVDTDPMAVTHSRDIVASNIHATAIRGDVRYPEWVLDHADVRGLLDLDAPVAAIAAGVLHFVPDGDDPQAIIARLMARLAPGSHLVLSHGADADGHAADAAKEIFRRSGIPIQLRDRKHVAALFGDLTMVEPGLVWLPEWRPEGTVDGAPEAFGMYAGVARRG